MKAVVAAFNQEKALVGAFSVITNLRMQLFEALITTQPHPASAAGDTGKCDTTRHVTRDSLQQLGALRDIVFRAVMGGGDIGYGRIFVELYGCTPVTPVIFTFYMSQTSQKCDLSVSVSTAGAGDAVSSGPVSRALRHAA